MKGTDEEGTPMAYQLPRNETAAPRPEPRNGFGIAALVLGIVGAGLGLIPLLGLFAVILGVLGAVFGILGYARRGASNKKMCVAATLISFAAIALGIWGMVIVGRAVEDLGQKVDQFNQEISSAVAAPLPPAVATGQQIVASALIIERSVGQGCGPGKAITCQQSVAFLRQYVSDTRTLMGASADSAFYGEAYRIADRVEQKTDPAEVRAAAIQFVRWVVEHPTA